jgi:two-component system response regulator VicR
VVLVAKKVLVVDDEPAIANLAKVKLTNEGFDVVTAHSGKEALEKVAGEPPDAIVLDVMMPGMDGWEVASRLRGDPETKDIPILMLTALGIPEERVPGFADIDEYHTKPFEPATLVKLVRRLTSEKG